MESSTEGDNKNKKPSIDAEPGSVGRAVAEEGATEQFEVGVEGESTKKVEMSCNEACSTDDDAYSDENFDELLTFIADIANGGLRLNRKDLISCLHFIALMLSKHRPYFSKRVNEESELGQGLWKFVLFGVKLLMDEITNDKAKSAYPIPLSERQAIVEKYQTDYKHVLSAVLNVIAEDPAGVTVEKYGELASLLQPSWHTGLVDELGCLTYQVLIAITANQNRTRYLLQQKITSVKQLVERAKHYHCESAEFGLLVHSLANMELVTGRFKEGDDYVFLQYLVNLNATQNVQYVITLLRNLSIYSEAHSVLMNKYRGGEMLCFLLQPIVVVKDATYSEDETQRLPQAVSSIVLDFENENKTIDPDVCVRRSVLEALYQLCARREHREQLREQNIYYLLREYHKFENDETLRDLSEKVVNLLIQTEQEIGADDLKTLPVTIDCVNTG